jgi:hypothetical protein
VSLHQPSATKQSHTLGALSVTALVALLLGARRPSAIIWRIGAVIVAAIYRVMTRWSAPHVGKEVFVRLAPTITHRDSAAPIRCVPIGVGVIAPLEQATPRLKLWRPSPTAGFTVSSQHGANDFSLIATATDGPAALQQGSHDDALRPAVASAAPESARAIAARSSKHSQSSKAVALREGKCTGHNRLYQRMAHVAQQGF